MLNLPAANPQHFPLPMGTPITLHTWVGGGRLSDHRSYHKKERTMGGFYLDCYREAWATENAELMDTALRMLERFGIDLDSLEEFQ